jgi:hypothetical protein
MAEPTLRDLLDAIAKLDAKIDAKVDGLRTELTAKVDSFRSELGAKVDAHRAETARGFAEVHKTLAELDAELARHADPAHRELEERVTALERAARKPAPRTPARAPRRR